MIALIGIAAVAGIIAIFFVRRRKVEPESALCMAT
jgi:LPXTG-motif cell wall-anchored protein